jgi:transposase
VLEQTKKRGRRLNILGFHSLGVSFDYGLKLGSFKGDTYVKLLDWQALLAAKRLADTGQITVIVQDNHPIHTSKAVRTNWQRWQEQGLYLFQLPKYSSQMNLIESEWHQLKTHELAGRIFEDEYDLALAIINGVEARAQRGQYSSERFLFNSA